MDFLAKNKQDASIVKHSDNMGQPATLIKPVPPQLRRLVECHVVQG